MVEGEAKFVSEADLLEGVFFAKEAMLPLIEAQEKLQKLAGVAKRAVKPVVVDELLLARVKELAYERIGAAVKLKAKNERHDQIDLVKAETIEALKEEFEGSAKQIKGFLGDFEYDCVRADVLNTGIRIDGRTTNSIRPISTETGFLPRVHGSALFTRGETQALVAATLGTSSDEQRIDSLYGASRKRFLLHYNFPPFSVGETSFRLGPGRREIGHGALAERSLLAILPNPEDFPYTIRIVSEITESNGSSSMASVCGGCLAMMDAGVPIKATCAGISVGRFTSKDGKVTHVTDIIGEEDFFGEMDFKVSGTREGITGIQLDLKARGLGFEEIATIFTQAREGRLQLIEKIEAVIAKPRAEMSQFAPRITKVKIDPEKIGKLIGPGGKTIRSLQERTGAQIDVEEDGTVFIACSDAAKAAQAKLEVEALGAEIKVGSVFEGKVVAVKEFGAFVELVPGTDGMCHISELAHGFVKNVLEHVKIGESIKVKVINVDENGRIKLSRKALLTPEPAPVN